MGGEVREVMKSHRGPLRPVRKYGFDSEGGGKSFEV